MTVTTEIRETTEPDSASREFGEHAARVAAAQLLALGRTVESVREWAAERPQFDYMWTAIADAMDALLAEGFDIAAAAEELRTADEAARPSPGTGRDGPGWEQSQEMAAAARSLAELPDTEPGERAQLLRFAARVDERAEAARQAGLADVARTFLAMGWSPARVREDAAGIEGNRVLLELADIMDRLDSAAP